MGENDVKAGCGDGEKLTEQDSAREALWVMMRAGAVVLAAWLLQ